MDRTIVQRSWNIRREDSGLEDHLLGTKEGDMGRHNGEAKMEKDNNHLKFAFHACHSSHSP